MTVITLLTDFGLDDEYVGVMKGVILTRCPDARIVDISHGIPAQQVAAGALMLQAAYRYFPLGTVHVVVVDPGVGSDRGIVAMACGGYRFLAPDNGLLSLIMRDGPVTQAVRVENADVFLSPVSRTFHGRDIFAPVAAFLAGGSDISELGPSVAPETVQRIALPEVSEHPGGALTGTVLAQDRFGNLITNIDRQRLERLQQFRPGRRLRIRLGAEVIGDLRKAYAEAAIGNLVALIGSRGLLEIAVNGGSAVDITGAGPGDTVTVHVEGADSVGSDGAK